MPQQIEWVILTNITTKKGKEKTFGNFIQKFQETRS